MVFNSYSNGSCTSYTLHSSVDAKRILISRTVLCAIVLHKITIIDKRKSAKSQHIAFVFVSGMNNHRDYMPSRTYNCYRYCYIFIRATTQLNAQTPMLSIIRCTGIKCSLTKESDAQESNIY